MDEGLTRRLLVGGLLGAPLAACATGASSERDIVQVNLTRGALPPPPGALAADESDGAVRTGFDAVRRMIVEARVNGAGPYRFVVDTGASHSVLATEVAEALDLESSGQVHVHGIAGVLPSTTATIRRLAVGELVSRRVRMAVLPRQYLGADGLLGVDVLARRRATLDFEHQTFSLASASTGLKSGRGRASRLPSDEDAGEIVVPARHRFGQLTIVDAELGGVALTAFLDSGAEVTVGNPVLREALLGRPGLLDPRPTQVELVSATGQLVDGEMHVVPPLRLGGVRMGNLSCVFADLHTFKVWQLTDRPAMLIGVDVMRHFDSITLNFDVRSVTFRSRKFASNVAPKR